MDKPVIRVSEVMKTTLHTINGLASVGDAVAKMKRLGVSSLVIERRHTGDEHAVVSMRDIAAGVVTLNRSSARTSVYEVMTKPALAVSATMNIKYAIRLLSRVGANRALVTNGDALVGLVTLRDLVIGYVGEAESEE